VRVLVGNLKAPLKSNNRKRRKNDQYEKGVMLLRRQDMTPEASGT